jgi:P-type E1-E2 ATPase
MYLDKDGYRVIAMCQHEFTRRHYDSMIGRYGEQQDSQLSHGEDLDGFPSNEYCFTGFFSLLDPPRVEAPDSVLKARGAQIRVVMVTGDHPTTAKAIAKQVHILHPKLQTHTV